MQNLRGPWTLFKKELLRFWRVSFQTVAAPVMTALLYLLVFSHVLEGRVQVHGGGTLIFDEFGRLKFHIHNHLARSRQRERLEHLHAAGALEPDGRRRFAAAHLARTLGQRRGLEDWD